MTTTSPEGLMPIHYNQIGPEGLEKTRRTRAGKCGHNTYIKHQV